MVGEGLQGAARVCLHGREALQLVCHGLDGGHLPAGEWERWWVLLSRLASPPRPPHGVPWGQARPLLGQGQKLVQAPGWGCNRPSLGLLGLRADTLASCVQPCPVLPWKPRVSPGPRPGEPEPAFASSPLCLSRGMWGRGRRQLRVGSPQIWKPPSTILLA